MSKLLFDEAEKLGISVPDSHSKNLMRKLSNMFEELQFVSYQHNNVLVYSITLEMQNVIIENFELNSELKLTSSKSDNKDNVLQVAKLLNCAIKNQQPQMSWPPTEEDRKAEKISSYIPHLLDIFLTVLISGQSWKSMQSKAERTLRLKDSFAQDIVFSDTNGAVKTPKSVLFPSVVKGLSNNTETVKIINKYRHAISYDLLEEIETEFALKVINEQTENRVVIPTELKEGERSYSDGLMITDNIDNLECTISGSGTSHRVNSIFVLEKKQKDNGDNAEDKDYEPPSKKKCKRSLPSDTVTREIPEYYGTKRVGPGEQAHVQNLGMRSSYDDKAKLIRMHYLVWLEARKLKTHPSLLVPGWTGFNIKVVVVESTIGYLDTLDSPATDLKTAYEVLSRGCEIRDRLQLKAVACVFDQAFYAKAMEVKWKHNTLFDVLIIMMGGFHLLMMLLGVIGSRFSDAGIRELAVQSDVMAKGSMEKVISGKHYNRAVRLHKIMYEALMRVLIQEFESSLTDESNAFMLNKEKHQMEVSCRTRRI